MRIEPVTLTGHYVRLEPLSLDHLDPLCVVGLDEELWRLALAPVLTRDDMAQYIEEALTWQRQGSALPFATIDVESDRVVGSTRFANIDTVDRHGEIGWTWIAQPWQRTPVNTEAKLLMLAHAFETWGCVRVELKTDALNERSRNAILRIGAKEEGTLRSHIITSTGRRRDTVYYSILDNEWPGVKKKLEGFLERSA